jgi:hypothetical protein
LCANTNCGTPQETGACCLSNPNPFFSCIVTTEAECIAKGGKYKGTGTSCVNNPCGQPPATGACCLNSPLLPCIVTTEADCLAKGGKYQGNGTNCVTNPCGPPPATGACCLVFPGTPLPCIVTTEAECKAKGGTYLGNGTSCANAPCGQPPSLGACCIEKLGAVYCVLTTEAICTALGGKFQGAGTRCNTPCGTDDVSACPGDLNEDGVRNEQDLAIMVILRDAAAIAESLDDPADLTGDLLVDDLDVLAMLELVGQPCD